MKQEYLLSKANKYDRSEANIKVINKLPRPEPNFDWLNKPTLFDRFLTYSFPLFCGIAWLCILLAIFS